MEHGKRKNVPMMTRGRKTSGKRPMALILCALLACGILFGPGTAFAEMEGSQLQEPAALPALSDAPAFLDEAELNQWMENYVTANNLVGAGKDFSVGFIYTGTGESWFYNAEVFLYSASLYKVPVSMLMAEREAAGELTQDSIVMGMTLQYLESTALTYSNNDSGHAMVDYLGGTYLGKCSDMTIGYTDLPEDYFVEDFYVNSYYTARYITQVMNTLYEGGEERFPHVLEYLLPAQPDNYLNISLKGKYELAQKYGSYQEPNGNENNHIAAVVYTPNPVIITVMTRNVGDYQMRMAEIGTYLTDYAQELDSRYDNWQQQERLRKEAEALQQTVKSEEEPGEDGEQADAEEQNTLPGEETEAAVQPAEEIQEEAVPAQEHRGILTAVIIAAALVLLAVVLLLMLRRRMPAAKTTRRSTARVADESKTGVRRESETRRTVKTTESRQSEKRGKNSRDGGYRPRH